MGTHNDSIVLQPRPKSAACVISPTRPKPATRCQSANRANRVYSASSVIKDFFPGRKLIGPHSSQANVQGSNSTPPSPPASPLQVVQPDKMVCLGVSLSGDMEDQKMKLFHHGAQQIQIYALSKNVKKKRITAVLQPKVNGSNETQRYTYKCLRLLVQYTSIPVY